MYKQFQNIIVKQLYWIAPTISTILTKPMLFKSIYISIWASYSIVLSPNKISWDLYHVKA